MSAPSYVWTAVASGNLPMLQLLQTFFPSLLAFSLAAQTPPSQPAAPAKTKAPAAKAKTKAPAGADALVAKVQKVYDNTKDFSADFIQTYTRIALSKTSESRGTVQVLKPGMMRWDYKKPEEQQIVADGKQLYIYDIEDQHVTIDPKFQLSDQGSSLSFLWGQGKLTDSFNVSIGDKKLVNAPEGTEVLELKPKKDATYTKLALVVDSATGQVKESILYETTGNINRFKFDNTKTNTGLKAELFNFKPPPGVEIAVIER